MRYRVQLEEPTGHEIAVSMVIPALPDREEVTIGMPAWAPGSYLVRDFVRHVYDLEVTDARGRPLPISRADKQHWRIVTGGRAATVRYRVFAFEETVRTSYFDDRHAYWNGTSLFFYLEGDLARPHEVEVHCPRGWRVSTALPQVPGRTNVFRAPDYDVLVDSPFEVGTHDLHTFRVEGTRFEVALFGRTNADVPRVLADLKRIVTATGRLFGGFPFDRYLFIVHALTARGGGLEHAQSCTLSIAGLAFEEEKAYQRFNELAAHEFFHAWNVKRIHDRLLGPFDYSRETHTRLLWFHEGFTEYMESIVLLRAGLLTPQTYLGDLAEDWGRYETRPGRDVTPLSELSFEAWIKLYKPADNHHNRTVSYYEKGKWAALVLEILLRQGTKGRHGVETLFQRLWRKFGRKGLGLDEADIEAEVSALGGRAVGGYFRRFVHGREPLPVLALLRRAGITVRLESPSRAEKGDAIKAARLRGWAGITWVTPGPPGDRAVVRTVVPGSPAWKAGLTYGDEVVAVGGARVLGSTVTRRLLDRPPGHTLEVHVFRRELLRITRLTLGRNPERRLRLEPAPHPGKQAVAIRRGWLRI